jgi:hypothetical protein
MMKKWTLLIIAAFSVTLLIIAYNYVWRNNSGISSKDIDYQIDADSLFDEFVKEEKAASLKFLNKIILLKGKVSEIIQTDEHSLVIILETRDELYGINCKMDTENKKQLKCKPGDTLLIKGRLTGIMGDILLGNCLIIN